PAPARQPRPPELSGGRKNYC
ncbi:hypothetical protein STRIP9103_03125, partial [Streptomyces ipomoeae 91-03]